MQKACYKIVFLGVIVALIMGALFFQVYQIEKTPKIVITPENALLDEPIEISISNLAANKQFTLELSGKDIKNNLWVSRATFQTNNKGMINIAKQAPIAGSYNGIDPMGLFWSMGPTIKDQTLNMLSGLNLTPLTLSIFSDNKLLAQKTIRRLFIAPDVEKKEIREHGIVGTLFYPKGKKSPGVIIIPGSSGQLPSYVCQILASHGYAVLELIYFGTAGLPKEISLIPLEYFHNAMQWLKKQPCVDGNKIALLGQSTGGQLSLLLAATFPDEMAAAIAISPNNLVQGGSVGTTSAWTYKNKPLPFFPSLNDTIAAEAEKNGFATHHTGTIKDPILLTPWYEFSLKKFNKFIKQATISVEKIRCPLLILSGDDDQVWPSSLFGARIIERLDLSGSKIKRKFINYLYAGNNLLLIPSSPSIDLPYQLSSESWALHGGTLEGNARAHEEAWHEILNFLDETARK